MTVDAAALKKLARLAKLAVDDAELRALVPELAAIVRHVDSLRAVDTTGVPPMRHGAPLGVDVDVRAAVRADVDAAIAAARAVEDHGAVDVDAGGDVDPRALMDALQDVVVDHSDAIVMSESGTSFTWCNARLRFASPRRYRTSAAWGSMGHVTAGAVGAALAGPRPVVAVVGDGAMLMNNEINTAVQYGARVVWVVLNDAQLGLNEHGMRALGMTPVETQLPRVDFVAFARSQGAKGIAVAHARELRGALRAALADGGPVVVDVRVDRSVPSPVVADRTAMLRRQARENGPTP